MEKITIAIQSPGDMGHGVGRDLIQRGFRVLTCLVGRSPRSAHLAQAAGFEVVADFASLVAQSSIILSIVPPATAKEMALNMRQAMHAVQHYPCYADCNAIAPRTVRTIAQYFGDTPCIFIDAGIVGLAPHEDRPATRFYCSGPDTTLLEALAGGRMHVHRLGSDIGQASAMKMIYASVTKGTMTLHAAALIAAQMHGLLTTYAEEMQGSLPHVWSAMQRTAPRLPLDAGRWVGEMHEIAQFFVDSGLPQGFHQGAAEIFDLLNTTPIAAETRENVDTNRTLEAALEMYAAAIREHSQKSE